MFLLSHLKNALRKTDHTLVLYTSFFFCFVFFFLLIYFILFYFLYGRCLTDEDNLPVYTYTTRTIGFRQMIQRERERERERERGRLN